MPHGAQANLAPCGRVDGELAESSGRVLVLRGGGLEFLDTSVLPVIDRGHRDAERERDFFVTSTFADDHANCIGFV